MTMQIWVDADACPVAVKDILFRAAKRTGIQMFLVANRPLQVPPAPNIRFIQVPSGFDVADAEIVKRLQAGDLVITSDIPLADLVITKGGRALSPRGEWFSPENIKERLNMRDFMENLRNSGIQTGGSAPFNNKDKQAFANKLDQCLARI